MSQTLMSRRKFFKSLGAIALTGSAAGLGFWGYISEIEPAWIEITEQRLPLKRLSPAFAGFRLLQISDIHLGNWLTRAHLDQIIRMALEQKPDLIALTGDFLPGHGWEPRHATLLDELAAGLRPLAQAVPTLAILGNHDHWSRPSAVRQMLAQAGAVDLSNTFQTLTRGDAQLHIAGVDSLYAEKARLDQVLAALPESGAAILLAHEPDFADISAPTGRFDLQISGHSHGGQVVLPGRGPILLPKYGRKYHTGLYRVGEMWQYTNRGVGLGRYFVRLNCRPEMTVYVINRG